MIRASIAYYLFSLTVGVVLWLGTPSAAPAQCSHLSPPPVTDTPDDGFVDANGDNIDGMECGPIYVAPSGDDRNLGTIDAPMKTLGAAILAAKWFSPPRSVYVSSNGGYTETVVFIDGVNVYGGYHHTLAWSRDNTPASVSGGKVAAWVEGLTAPLNIDRLAITAANNTTPGGLSIGMVSRLSSASLDLRASEIRGGNGSAGTGGINGSSGAGAANGNGGGNGTCDGSTPGQGGLGGSSPVGNTGGSGGDGGPEGSNDGQTGFNGLGPAGGIGGTRGFGGDLGGDGGNGQPGGIGANGANGLSGATFYASGGNGVAGINGSGGGGGGGGGGQGCTLCNDGAGNGGGGGGGGGAAGTAGTGGVAGGSSYGIVAVGTTVTATNGLILANPGASGGSGGAGGTGGLGGLGANGATNCSGEIGTGGNGGAGGKGGNGGDGGGGAGGNSIVVLRESGATFNSTGTTLTAGAFGAGGASPGSPGVNGVSSQDFSWGGTTALPVLSAPTSTYALIVTDQDVTAAPVTPLVADHAGFTYTFSIVSPAAHGTAGVAANQLTYDPQSGYFGADSFGFRATRVGPNTFVDGYAVVVINPDCSSPDFVFDEQPLGQVAVVGQPASLSVAVSGGTPPYDYQWRKNTVDLVNGGAISGADTATLTINPFAPGDAGSYDVVVADACDELISDAAVLTACNGPDNLDFNCDGFIDGLDVQIFVDRLLE